MVEALQHDPNRRARLAIRLGLAALLAGHGACRASEQRFGDPVERPDAEAAATQDDASVPGADAADPEPTLSEASRARLLQMSPTPLPAAKPDVSNKWADDPRAASFGQRLFFDPRFSGRLLDGDNDGSPFALGRKGESAKVACAGCHVPEDQFSDTRSIRQQISLGAGWGLRRAPSLLDIGQSTLFNWDGRRDSLHTQTFGPLQSAVEMNSSRLFAARQVFLNHRTEYEALFGPMPAMDDEQRFPVLNSDQTGCSALDARQTCTGPMRGEPGDGAEFDGMTSADQDAVTRVWVNVGKAIAAYERLLTCGESAFDRWIHGDETAISAEAKRGAALFTGEGRCVSCHSGPFFSDEAFHNVGLKPTVVATVFLDANDRGAGEGLPALLASPLNVKGTFSDGDDGRLPTAVAPTMEGAFKTPRLRCVSARPSFMHTGQFTSLEAAVNFFVRGGDKYGYPGSSEISALPLDARDVADLVAFLRTLDGTGPDPVLLEAP